MKFIHIGETGIGSLCATGQLMQTLFNESDCVLLRDFCNLENPYNNNLKLSGFKNANNLIDVSLMIPFISDLCPDFIFIRLGSNKYINLGRLKDLYHKPVIVSVMDDIGEDVFIREILGLADKVWFISESLLNKYKKFAPRAHCFVAANGVKSFWGRKDNFVYKNNACFKINFSGNLNQNQSLDAVLFLCHTLSHLRKHSYPISLDIFSRSWQAQAKHFRPFASFVTSKPLVPLSQYRTNLQKYSALFFGYGASEEVIKYIRYSVSNKLPEVLCSGLPSIGYGSTACESLRLFQKYRPKYFVDATVPNSEDKMFNLIKSIFDDYTSHALKARHESRKLSNVFDLDSIAARFKEDLLRAHD